MLWMLLALGAGQCLTPAFLLTSQEVHAFFTINIFFCRLLKSSEVKITQVLVHL